MPKLLRLSAALRFILTHPLNRQHKLRALGRFLRWQIGSRLAPGPVIIPFVEGTRLIAQPGLMGATGIYYTGLYEFEEMAFTLHALRPGDRFVDVGAHIGAFSILAAGAAGARALAIEPVPASYAHLVDNIHLNGLSGLVRPLNMGIAAEAGRLHFTTGKGAANGVLPSTAVGQVSIPAIEVDVLPLDALTADFPPTLLKIDVEGYEHAVIAGATKTLADERLLAILIELRGHGARYNFDETAIHRTLLAAGFRPYSYTPSTPFKGEPSPLSPPFSGEPSPLTPQFNGEPSPLSPPFSGEPPSSLPPVRGEPQAAPLIPLPGINQAAGTTLYIRDLPQVTQRLRTARRFRVHGQQV